MEVTWGSITEPTWVAVPDEQIDFGQAVPQAQNVAQLCPGYR